MKASEVIEKLQERIDIYGDWEIIFRDPFNDDDYYIFSVYADDGAEQIIISSAPDFTV